MPNWRRYLRFWGPDVDADIDDELDFHIESRVSAYLAAGHSPDDARRIATKRFGDVRSVRGVMRRHDIRKLRQRRRADTVDELMQDIRYGARKLLQAPSFTLAVIAVLALGIGANTAIYSAVDAAFFRPLPFANPDRLVSLPRVEVPANLGGPGMPRRARASADFTDFVKLDVFESFAVHAIGGLNLEGGIEPQRVSVAHVSLDFFKTLGRFPINGRVFTAEEEAPGGPHAVILSHRVWRTQFGSNASVVGTNVTLNKNPYRIIGIMPADFTFPADADVWVPLPMPADWGVFEAFKSFMNSSGVARLAPGVTALQAAQRVLALERQYPVGARVVVNDSTLAGAVAPLQRSLLPQVRRNALVVLMVSATLVLLIACANVVNLLLSRAVGRRREMAIRTVLGATRGRIFRQLIVESVMLSVAGAVAGLLVARLGLSALNGLLSAELTAVAPTRIDPRILLFALGVALTTGMIFGVWPAFGATRSDAGETIKSGGAHGATERDGTAVRSGLAIVEMALAVVLLIASGLMLESFHALMSTPAGLETNSVTTAQTTLPTAKYHGRAAIDEFQSAVLDRLRAMRGVQGAAAVNVLPLAHQNSIGLFVRSAEGGRIDENDPLHPEYLQITPGYFSVMGITLLRGRDLSARDDSTTSVAVINKAMADAVWRDQDPIGRHFSFGADNRLVIGVVADVRTRHLEEKAEPQMYFPLSEVTNNDVTFVVRGTLAPELMAARLRDAVHAVDPKQAVYNTRSMNEVVAESVAPRRTNTVLLVIFGIVAASLAAIGVYGVLAYGVAQRTREIGVRIALGAQRTDVVGLVLRQGALLTVIGVGAGVAAAYALSRLIESQLYEVGVHDPRIFVGAPLLLLAVAVVATALPAARAARVDPVVALREE